MANSDASSATVNVLVSFYLVATDESGSNTRTSVIHKEKFNVPQSGVEPIGLSNIVKHLLKTFTGLAEIAKSKGLGEKPARGHDTHIVLFHHTGVQKAISSSSSY